MSNYVKLYKRLSKFPAGTSIFNIALSRKSPYVSQLKPKVSELRQGYAQIDIAKRKALHNHLGTIDSNALFTLSQLTMGLSIETAIPKNRRWIPVGANVEYVKLAQTAVTATCDCTDLDFGQDNIEVSVTVKDTNGEPVQRAVIQLNVSAK